MTTPIEPTPITPGPVAPLQRNNSDAFRIFADAFATWIIAVVSEFVALGVNAYHNALSAYESANAAANSAASTAIDLTNATTQASNSAYYAANSLASANNSAASAAASAASASTASAATAFSDANAIAKNAADNTKQLKVSLAGLTSGQTRTITVPDKNFTVASTDTNTFTGAQNFAAATVASSATTSDIWGASGNLINWTGTTTTTAFPNAPQAGAERVLVCSAACSFTASANMMIDGVTSGNTVTCASGDKIIVRALSTTSFLLTRQKSDGRAQVAPLLTLPRSQRTSNTILAINDTGTLIDVTGTFAQTLTAAATLGNGWFCHIGNSGIGFVTLTPNGTEKITVNGVDRSTWILWPREMGLLVCIGTGFNYYCIQKGEITQTIGAAVASVSFATGLAFRSRLSLTYEDIDSSGTGAVSLQINASYADRGDWINVNGTIESAVTNNTNIFLAQAITTAGAILYRRVHGQVAINPGLSRTVLEYQASSYPGSAYNYRVGQALYTAINNTNISSIDISIASGTMSAGTFVLREL